MVDGPKLVSASDGMTLMQLIQHPGYLRLQMGWAGEGKIIHDAMKKACREKGSDQSLRYYAGMWEGFDAAIGMLERMIHDAEKDGEVTSSKLDAIINRSQRK